MKIKFNGVSERKTRGCPVCGHAKVTTVFSTTKTYYLPSGHHEVFRAGQVYEVDDRDGKFLLSYKNAFEVV